MDQLPGTSQFQTNHSRLLTLLGPLLLVFLLLGVSYFVYSGFQPADLPEKVAVFEVKPEVTGREIPAHVLEFALSRLDKAFYLVSEANEKARKGQTEIREAAPAVRKYYLDKEYRHLIQADNNSEACLRLTAGAGDEIQTAKQLLEKLLDRGNE